jgi:alpha-ribazole phosphatase
MRIFLLRHGQTADNAAGRYTGAGDAALTDLGREQMAAAAQRLADAGIGRAWCSPSPRALQSARIALPGVAPAMDARLRERDMGVFEGLTYDEIARRYPSECEAWQRDWQGYGIPGGESYLQFYERVAGFWRELLAQDGPDVLLSTHGGVLQASYCFILGDPALFWKFACRNGDLAVAHYKYGNLYLGALWPGEPAGKESP